MLNIIRLPKKLTGTQTMLLESVQQFCNSELRPRVVRDYKYEIVDRSLFKTFGDMGVFGPIIPEYGCLGETYKTYGLIAKEIEQVDSGYRSMYSVQSSLVMSPIYKYAQQCVKDKYLPRLASGDYVGCFGLTEHHSGSDASAMKTVAIADGDSYVLNGSKMWISNAPIADVFIIWATMDGVIRGFVLDRGMNGIETSTIEGKLSLRASPTGIVHMDDVRVPKENILDIEGMRGPFSCLNDARLGISFGVLGASQSCIETALVYAQDREMFGASLSEKQLFQMKIADMVTDWSTSFATCLHVADMVDAGQSSPSMISLIKRNSCEKALNIARSCRDILGGNGISEDYEVFRHLCNLETVNTYEGTYDIHSLIIGSAVTGKKAF